MDKTSRTSNSPCSGGLVSQLRIKLGWSQDDLADRTGFTARLIRKAESGQVVSRFTVETLATAFRDQGLDVDLADLEMDPPTIARRFVECMYTERAGVIDALQEHIDDEVVFQFAGDPAVFPFAGRHIGINAARKAFHLFYSVIQPPETTSDLDDFQFLSTGRGALVWGKTWAHPIGMPMNEPITLAIRMDSNGGKLIHFDDRFDTAMGLEHFRRANQAR